MNTLSYLWRVARSLCICTASCSYMILRQIFSVWTNLSSIDRQTADEKNDRAIVCQNGAEAINTASADAWCVWVSRQLATSCIMPDPHHTAGDDATKMSSFVGVVGGVNRTCDHSRLSSTENFESEHFRNIANSFGGSLDTSSPRGRKEKRENQRSLGGRRVCAVLLAETDLLKRWRDLLLWYNVVSINKVSWRRAALDWDGWPSLMAAIPPKYLYQVTHANLPPVCNVPCQPQREEVFCWTSYYSRNVHAFSMSFQFITPIL